MMCRMSQLTRQTNSICLNLIIFKNRLNKIKNWIFKQQNIHFEFCVVEPVMLEKKNRVQKRQSDQRDLSNLEGPCEARERYDCGVNTAARRRCVVAAVGVGRARQARADACLRYDWRRWWAQRRWVCRACRRRRRHASWRCVWLIFFLRY